MFSLTGAICIEMQEKLIQKNQIGDHTGIIQKQPSVGIWKRILETYWLWKNNQGKPPKLSVWQKRNILLQTKRLREEMENFLVKISNGKSIQAHPLLRRQFVGFCKRLTWNRLIFRGKESCPKSFGNALHHGLFMFLEDGNVW